MFGLTFWICTSRSFLTCDRTFHFTDHLHNCAVACLLVYIVSCLKPWAYKNGWLAQGWLWQWISGTSQLLSSELLMVWWNFNANIISAFSQPYHVQDREIDNLVLNSLANVLTKGYVCPTLTGQETVVLFSGCRPLWGVRGVKGIGWGVIYGECWHW